MTLHNTCKSNGKANVQQITTKHAQTVAKTISEVTSVALHKTHWRRDANSLMTTPTPATTAYDAYKSNGKANFQHNTIIHG